MRTAIKQELGRGNELESRRRANEGIANVLLPEVVDLTLILNCCIFVMRVIRKYDKNQNLQIYDCTIVNCKFFCKFCKPCDTALKNRQVAIKNRR